MWGESFARRSTCAPTKQGDFHVADIDIGNAHQGLVLSAFHGLGQRAVRRDDVRLLTAASTSSVMSGCSTATSRGVAWDSASRPGGLPGVFADIASPTGHVPFFPTRIWAGSTDAGRIIRFDPRPGASTSLPLLPKVSVGLRPSAETHIASEDEGMPGGGSPTRLTGSTRSCWSWSWWLSWSWSGGSPRTRYATGSTTRYRSGWLAEVR